MWTSIDYVMIGLENVKSVVKVQLHIGQDYWALCRKLL